MKFYEKILEELKGEEPSMRTIYRHAFAFADEAAFEYSRNLVIHTVTYRQCRGEVLRICALLSRRAAAGSVVALVMPNSPLWVECFWAVLMAGCTVMPLSDAMPDGMLRDCLKHAGCALLLGDRRAEGCESIGSEELKGYRPEGGAPESEPADGWGDEVILSTSGTTGDPELFAYTGREIVSQILNSGYVLRRSKDISRFWKGRLKHLAFLPFSHIFGLTACYLWFAVFGRTFVFPEDYAPSTLLRTCRLHGVTHIFAVPLLWDSLARGIRAEAEKSGETAKLEKGIRLSLALQDTSPLLARALVPLLMKKVREKTLGDSVRFCISGGGMCAKDTGRTVNGCGYHLENGYGMTEIGIACVTLERRASRRTCGSVGKLFPSIEGRIGGNGHLKVRGRTCFAARYRNGKRIPRDTGAWFDTGDCFSQAPDGELTVLGRSDDIMNGSNGERISPESVEAALGLELPCCAVGTAEGLELLVEAPLGARISRARRQSIARDVRSALGKLPQSMRPRRVLYTYEPIPVSLSHKYRRKEIASLLDSGAFPCLEEGGFASSGESRGSEGEALALAREVAQLMGQALGSREPVGLESDFFRDLGGDSLSYIEFLNAAESAYRVEIPKEKTAECTTPLAAAAMLSKLAET